MHATVSNCHVSVIIPQCANIAIVYQMYPFLASIYIFKAHFGFIHFYLIVFSFIFKFSLRVLMQYPKICIEYMDGNPAIDIHYCGYRHSESCSFPRKQYKLSISSVIIWKTPEQTQLDMLYLCKDNIFLTS